MSGLFLSVRVLHILFGALWLGGATLLSFFLMPALRDAGPEGGRVMMGLIRRGLAAFIPSIAGLTVLSGIYLYWHFTDGFSPVVSASMGARVFGAGGVLGLVAAIIGGSVVGRSIKNAVGFMTQAAGAKDADARASLMQRAGQLRQRAATGGLIVSVLLIITIILMAIGHYV